MLPDTLATPVDATLALLRGLHTRWVVLFEALPDDAWARTAYHPENGIVTIDGMLKSYAQHGEDHVAQIWRIRERA